MSASGHGSSETQTYSSDTCHAYVDGVFTSYGYVPSLTAASTFVALFGVSMLGHAIQMVWFRTWWCSVFSLGCLVEILGWAARIWSAKCPYAQTPYLMQITTLIIVLTFFTAGIYVLLARFICIFGLQSSILSPKLYLWIFCTCDIISLVVQAAGGGMASSGAGETASPSSASSSSSSSSQSTGTHIMVGGIIFQLVAITVFVALGADFAWRVFCREVPCRRGNAHMPVVIALFSAMVFSVLLIYIRSIYRTIELLHGWTSSTMRNEKLLIGLDGAMMVPAVIIFNLFHPGQLLRKIEMRASSVPMVSEQTLVLEDLEEDSHGDKLGLLGRKDDSANNGSRYN
ncbi:RTA1 domain-containing protein [Aspergillus ibericus CBS 121593]|uniref:RTA1 domain protein n=1 Tax=Aspergillus ibericus CBS 121593 TaxID=1448316 RepID=A0A395GYA0_9EURO|nr:RTA1 domain protein [Aspergillus ibericus CBS 121593]RAL00055.1 RTA1 domain protein [Aspergillus ibericus CBS 121593]